LVKHLLLSPEASSTILREFSTYFKLNSEKRLKNINFPQALSIIDNPLFDNQSNSVPFDDEGIQSSETFLIEKGFIRNRISNIQNSFENQSITTGNGFRSQKSIFPEIKFTNLYIKPSTFPFSKLLSDGEKGILISLVKLMQVKDDKYIFSAYGYEFVDGNINKPIHLFLKTTIETFFLSILKVSKEIRFFYNILNVGAPYLLIEPGTKVDNTFEL
jgi:PmbA protein